MSTSVSYCRQCLQILCETKNVFPCVIGEIEGYKFGHDSTYKCVIICMLKTESDMAVKIVYVFNVKCAH